MIRYLLRRPVAVCIVTFSLAVLGLLTFARLPISLLPDIPVPEITVQLSYPAASARELQRTIEQPLRSQLLQVSHLEDLDSQTQDGIAVLTLRFAYGTNIQLAYLETNEKIDAVLGQLPRDMERPVVVRAGAGDIPVFNLNVWPGPQYREDFLALSDFSENVLKRRLEQLPDVALVDATGLALPEVVVQADASKLLALGLTEQQFAEALRQANLQPGNFNVREGAYQYNIRFSSVLQTVDDVGRILLVAGGPTTLTLQAQNDPRVSYFANNVMNAQQSQVETPRRLIALREVARVTLRERPMRGKYSFNGQRSVCLAIVKQSDAQVLHLRQALSEQLAAFRRDYPYLEFSLSQDQTELLDLSINNLISNLLTGALLTFGMIFLFMRDWRLPLLIGLVIPVSIAVTFLGFFLLELSINIVSLAGLVLGMGEIVDSAIIILENIEEKRDKGLSVEESCVQGSEEVIRPLFTSVLTNSAVFLPLLLLSGLAGALFYDQAVSVSLALGVSLACSYTLVPVLYALIYGRQRTRQVLPPTLMTRWLETAYYATFTAAFRFKGLLVLGLVLLVGGAIWMSLRLEKRGIPAVSRTELEVAIDWNQPLTVAENQQRINILTRALRPAPLYVSAFAGQQQFLLNRQPQTENQALLSLRTTSQPAFNTLASTLTQHIARQYPQAVAQLRPARNVFEQLFGTTAPALQLKLYNVRGQQPIEPAVAVRVGQHLTQAGLPVRPLRQQQQYRVQLLTDRLLLYDVAEDAVVQTLKTVFNRNQVINLTEQQRAIPLVLSGPDQQADWQNTFVFNQQKQAIPLRNLIQISPRQDYTIFYADKKGPYVPFDLATDGASIVNIQQRATTALSSETGLLPEWAGRYFQDQRYLTELLAIVAIAVTLLFCILTAQFESIQQPLIVLLIVGLGLAGAIWLLYLAGNSLNVLSAIGMVVLIGLLDNDSVLKIDTMNRAVGSMSLMDAIRLGGQRRLKSQIMTFLTTVLGLLPVLFSGGLGAELQQPLALSVVGGMCVGVLASWTIIPVLYWWIATRKAV